MNYQYNVKAIITNISDRIIFSGFKPTHNIKGYLTTGIHKYIDKDAIRIAESSIGFIAFITPELYIDNINEGDIVDFYDGTQKLGYAKIIEVYKGNVNSDLSYYP